MNEQFLQTDWVNTKPVFYNETTRKFSHNIHELIDYKNLELDAEGFNNYLEFGYSVFNQTPIKNIKFLDACSKISLADGNLKIENLPDPLFDHANQRSTPEQILDLLRKNINDWEDRTAGEIILPLSGGNDSRLIASMIKDPSRVRTFTYGISDNQRKSKEVVYAEAVAKKLGMRWNFVPLENIHKYFGEWDNFFGPSVHAHGMYHFPFYNALKGVMPLENVGFLSGIFGDSWAGAIRTDKFNSPDELIKISYNHGMCADRNMSLLKSKDEQRLAFWNKHKDTINQGYFQSTLFCRMKMILISYLLTIPESYGLRPYAPIFEPDIALGMLNLPQEIRQNRQWQADYFKSVGLDVENWGLRFDESNTLNLWALEEMVPPPLDTKLLKDVLNSNYIEDINNTLKNSTNTLRIKKLIHNIFRIPKVGGALKMLGFTDPYRLNNKEGMAYYAYLVIKPIELALQKSAEFKKR